MALTAPVVSGGLDFPSDPPPMVQGMEPLDPHAGKTRKFRAVFGDEVHETKIAAGLMLDLGAGKPMAYAVRDESISVEDDGTTVHRDSAVPLDGGE